MIITGGRSTSSGKSSKYKIALGQKTNSYNQDSLEDVMEVTEWSNPNYGKSGYDTNCQRCVVAFEVNMRGYNVAALPNSGNSDIYPHSDNWTKFFGKDINSMVSVSSTSVSSQKNKILNQMGAWGGHSRAVLEVKWKGKDYGHVINIINTKSGVSAWDAQTGRRVSLDNILSRSSLKNTKLLRTDDANLNNSHIHNAIQAVKD